jgi:iron(II)-dependent oxidoreductase
MRQALYLGGEPGGEPAATPSFDREPEWVEFDAGEFEMGARRNGRFVYDNELPRHPASTGSFAIQNVPALDETGTPLQHLSWFDADALARRHGARLPTEGEWERAATSGQLDGIGAVWEWTSTDFNGYPGFEPYPYREYSEVFFGENYKVLRGGSWATSPFVATKTFRNWDLPQRSQIFSGVRLAKDL